MLRCVIYLRRKGLVDIRILEKSKLELELEDIAYRTVDLALGDLSFLHEFLDILDEAI